MTGSSTRSRSGPATGTAPAAARADSRTPAPDRTAHNVRAPDAPRGSARRKRAASTAPSSSSGSIADAATCTSPKPLNQRSGSATRRSTAAPSSVSTSTASKPTFSLSGSLPTTRASASRIGGLKSTLTVPGARRVASSPSSSTSQRACTPPQAENDSKRRPAGSLVTTGSEARILAATIGGGT